MLDALTIVQRIHDYADECDRLAELAAPSAFRDGYRLVSGRLREMVREADTLPAPAPRVTTPAPARIE